VIVFIILTRVEELKLLTAPYARFGLYLATMSCERFLIEFIRLNPRYSFGLSQAQLFAVVFVMCGLWLTFMNRRKYKH
jgi:prolipoprotein diacylglyceryltransferase